MVSQTSLKFKGLFRVLVKFSYRWDYDTVMFWRLLFAYYLLAMKLFSNWYKTTPGPFKTFPSSILEDLIQVGFLKVSQFWWARALSKLCTDTGGAGAKRLEKLTPMLFSFFPTLTEKQSLKYIYESLFLKTSLYRIVTCQITRFYYKIIIKKKKM